MRRTLLTSFGVIALFAACATPLEYPVLQTGEPTLSSGSLAFQGLDGNIYALLQDAESVVQITNDVTEDPALRYGGYAWVNEQVVFVAQTRSEENEIGARISVATPGRRSRIVATEPGSSPFFLYPSPDGSRVGYLGGRQGESGFVMSSVALETGEITLHGRGQPFYAAWSPDGRQLVTHVGAPTGTRQGSRLTLRESNESGENAGEQLSLTTGRFQAPAYAPNGESIAVVLADPDGSSGIHLLDADGEDAGRIVGLRGAGTLGWSPNGSQIAYIDRLFPAGASLAGPLAVVGGSRREPRVISRLAVAFFWSPDSTKLLYLEPFAREGSRSGVGYRVGLYRAFDAETQIIATILPAPEFVQQIVPFFDQYNHAYSIWAPDSRNVVLNTLAATGERVVILVDTENSIEADSFRVSFMPVQDQDESAANLGFVAPQGVDFRPLFYGTVPFFSRVERAEANDL